MNIDFLNTVKENLVINFKRTATGDIARDDEGYILFEEDGHKIVGRPIREHLKRIVRDEYPDLYKKVEEHTSDTFYKSTERTPPFTVFFIATGIITVEDYCNKILAAPKDAQVVADMVEEKEFKDKLYQAYEVYEKHVISAVAPTTMSKSTFVLKAPPADKLDMLDRLLPSFDLPAFSDILKEFKAVETAKSTIDSLVATVDTLKKTSEQEKEELQGKIKSLAAELVSRPFTTVEVKASGEIPSGKVTTKSVKDIFPGITLDFQVPFWEWDGPHPDVPAIDEDYIFREKLLVDALYAITSNSRMYLQGDTGSGKTTLVEQIAARLNWPFGRINFDSEITRMDLIGRDTLKEGKTVFVDGFLPKYMSGPYILCFDEIDFVRPDVAYVMQAALEGNSLLLTEDGGRRVTPHPMMRMFGTGNTVGQGDERGMYQGARPQSMAFLDRFTVWATVDYLTQKERRKLLEKRVPSLAKFEVDTIIKYTEEHLAAFRDARVMQPISPRGMIALGKTLAHLQVIYPKHTTNLLKDALESVVLARATQSDRITLKGIVDRVCK